MLAGPKGKERGIFKCLRALRVKQSGLTLAEVLVVAFISLVMLIVFSPMVNLSDLVGVISGARLEVQQEVRRSMDWMANDLRQTSRMCLLVIDQFSVQQQFNLLGSGATFSDPVFNICQGYNDPGGINWSANTIGYSFDAANQRIIRTDSASGQTWDFNSISSLTFQKVGMNVLRITITGTRVARGTIQPAFTLETEVKLRNE